MTDQQQDKSPPFQDVVYFKRTLEQMADVAQINMDHVWSFGITEAWLNRKWSVARKLRQNLAAIETIVREYELEDWQVDCCRYFYRDTKSTLAVVMEHIHRIELVRQTQYQTNGKTLEELQDELPF